LAKHDNEWVSFFEGLLQDPQILFAQFLQLAFVPSQAARQGLAVLMACAVVGDYVREVTNPAKFGLGPTSGRDATWGRHIRVL